MFMFGFAYMSLGMGFYHECEVFKTVEVSKTVQIASSFFYKTIKMN